LMVLTGLPYLFGYFLAGPNEVYNGLHSLGSADLPVYYSYLKQVEAGQIFFKDLFTTEDQQWGTINWWWLVVGMVAKLFHLSAPLAFHLSRLLMIPVLIYCLNLFAGLFFTENKERKLAVIFTSLIGGFGVFVALPLMINDMQSAQELYNWPIDLWLTEAYVFSLIYQSSHFIVSLVFTLMIFYFFIRLLKTNHFKYLMFLGLLVLLYFNFHPYYWPTIFGTLGLYLAYKFFREKKINFTVVFYYLLILAASLPPIVYHFWLIKVEPVVAYRALQNVTYLASWPYLLAGLGFLVPGFILGSYYIKKNRSFDNFSLLYCWFFINLFLAYSPLQFHSRYTQGLTIVMAFLTLYGLNCLRLDLAVKKSAVYRLIWQNNFFWAVIFIFCFLPTPLFLMARDYSYFFDSQAAARRIFYLPNDFYLVADFLNRQPQTKAVVSDNQVYNLFWPSTTLRPVYYAHDHETIFSESKIARLKLFFSEKISEQWGKDFMQKNQLAFIITDSKKTAERLSLRLYLKEVFSSGDFRVFQFIP